MTGRADIQAANPATGEVLEHLDQQPPEKLAEALDAVHARQAELKRWNDALEAELRRRLKLVKRSLYVWGEWEVEARPSRESDWDVDELRGVLDSLVEDGTVRAGEVGDIIIQPPPYAARARARELRDRLSGDAREAVEACCTWREKPAKLTVARSVNLLDAAPAAEETPPVGGRTDRDGTAPAADPVPAGSPEPPAAPTLTLDPEELFA